MSRHDDRYDHRQERREKSGWMFILLLVGFVAYIGFDNGWINGDTLKSILPNKEPKVELCEQNGFVPPCVTVDGIEVVPNTDDPLLIPTEQIVPADLGRPLTFVDEGGNAIVGMPVKHWVGDEQITSTTNELGQITVYGDGFDANDEHSWIIWSGGSGLLNGRQVIVVH